MLGSLATALIAALFVGVASLVGYGLYAFRHAPDSGATWDGGRRVDVRREVVWTALAALLLLVIVWYAR